MNDYGKGSRHVFASKREKPLDCFYKLVNNINGG